VPIQYIEGMVGTSNGGWGYISSYGYNVMGTGWIPGNLQQLGLAPIRHPPPPQTLASGPITWVSESKVRAPSDMIAIGDAYAEGLHNSTMLSPENPSSPDDWYMGTIHRDGANIVFCDGHVEYGKTEDWIRPTETARMRWNNDNQPHPETGRTSDGS
jgi:prepilin-type processing-associated H-X9-DG protein